VPTEAAPQNEANRDRRAYTPHVRAHSRFDWAAVGRWAPVVFVALIAAAGLGMEQGWQGPDIARPAVAAALALPLVVRSTRPLVAAIGTGIAFWVQVALGGGLGLAAFLAMIIVAYSCGRWCRSIWAAMLGAAVVFVAAAGATVWANPAERAEDLAYPIVYLAAAVAAGLVVRRQAVQTAELARLNADLAAQVDVAAQLAAVTERMRLARDLHDSLAHTLTVTVVQAEAAEVALGEDERTDGETADSAARDRARQGLRQIQETSRRGLEDLRDTLRVLRSASETPRLTELDVLGRVLGDSGLTVQTRMRGPIASLPEPLSEAAYRIVQEALTNVVRHSDAVDAVVDVEIDRDALRLTITDPGPAVATERAGARRGIAGMRERLAPWLGEVVVGPNGSGWQVRATVPLAGVAR